MVDVFRVISTGSPLRKRVRKNSAGLTRASSSSILAGPKQGEGILGKDWKSNFLASLKGPTARGDYRAALEIAKRELRARPDEFICQYQYAKMLGDYADELPPARKKRMKAEAVRVLKPLLRRLSGVPLSDRFGACLNYYYQREDFSGMYRFGRRFRKTDAQKSYYAQGISGSLLSFEHHESGRSARARAWAKKAARAWSLYDLSKDRYYFAHYSAAKAAVLAGDRRAAMRHLKRAAVLAKRPLGDWEFEDVMTLLREAR